MRQPAQSALVRELREAAGEMVVALLVRHPSWATVPEGRPGWLVRAVVALAALEEADA